MGVLNKTAMGRTAHGCLLSKKETPVASLRTYGVSQGG
jgi:hypothetical protein